MNGYLRTTLTLALVALLALSASADPRRRRKSRLNSKQAAAAEDTELEEPGAHREGKLFNVFQVIRFPNSDCNTTSGDSGVCYTTQECENRGGVSSGSCASGFGTCCSFNLGCGAVSSQNNTYFTSTASDNSPCSVQICKCDTNVCQIRLDFNTFSIADPDASNLPAEANPTVPSSRTQCLDAQFTATSAGTTPPVLCGTNTGQHMILEASDACNNLAFTYMNNDPRSWKIKISQISCDDPNKPPTGCLQYFTGAEGTVTSYNYNMGNGRHLANQNYANCVRTEQGFCSIEWSETTNQASFQISTSNTNQNSLNGNACSQDYVLIPGGFETDPAQASEERYCGSRLFIADNNNFRDNTAYTVKSTQRPFVLTFVTNGGEARANNNNPEDDDRLDLGFSLNYKQIAC